MESPEYTFTVTIPAFTMEQKTWFDRLADQWFGPLMPEYCPLVARFVENYKKLFPKHLADDVHRICCGFFTGFYDTISAHCVKKRIFAAPKKDWVCDVLIQWKK